MQNSAVREPDMVCNSVAWRIITAYKKLKKAIWGRKTNRKNVKRDLHYKFMKEMRKWQDMRK